MKWFGMTLLISFALILGGCGGGNSPMTGNINGNWTAALTNTDGAPAFAFTATFTQTGVNGLNLTHFTFTTTSPCFVSGENAYRNHCVERRLQRKCHRLVRVDDSVRVTGRQYADAERERQKQCNHRNVDAHRNKFRLHGRWQFHDFEVLTG